MRKNSVRKFVHMAIDILPLLIIPIFAININQKSVEPIQVEVQEKISVDFNQISQNGYVDSTNGWFATQGTLSLQDNNLRVTCTSSNTGYFGTSIRKNGYFLNIIKDHKYMVEFDIYSNIAFRGGIYISNLGGTNNYRNYNANETTHTQFIATASSTFAQINVFFGFESAVSENDFLEISLFEVTDLTQANLEDITISEFNSMFSNSYYDYTLSQKMLVNKPTPTTYDDTDIGSQFLYSLYKPVQDYFNFNNLFNMGQIYDWIQLNLFNGTAPLPIFIIWNIIVYEFFVDLIFLLYAVFMFVIDFATCMIDSFMGKARKGV